VVDPAPDFVADPDDVAHGGLPSRSRFLCVGALEPSWVTLTLQLDAVGCHEPSFRWLDDPGEALGLLREESFDCLLLEAGTVDAGRRTSGAGPHFRFRPPGLGDDDGFRGDSFREASADPDEWHAPGAVTLLRAIRASGCDDPVVLLSSSVDDALVLEAESHQAELLVSTALWNSRALSTVVSRAVSRVRLAREHHRLSVSERRRSLRERDEATYLLDQQRLILDELLADTPRGRAASLGPFDNLREPSRPDRVNQSAPHEIDIPQATLGRSPARRPVELPTEVNAYYQELLRTFVIIGSGTLASDIRKLADLLAAADLTPREAMGLHLDHVENLVRGLGSRSTRHVMARADLLALEVMIHLAESYRSRSRERGRDDA
jgi:hypothetical protein